MSFEDLLSQQRSFFHQISHVFRGVMTPSLMPTGPDAQHSLDTFSMNVVVVIVPSSPTTHVQPSLLIRLLVPFEPHIAPTDAQTKRSATTMKKMLEG